MLKQYGEDADDSASFTFYNTSKSS